MHACAVIVHWIAYFGISCNGQFAVAACWHATHFLQASVLCIAVVHSLVFVLDWSVAIIVNLCRQTDIDMGCGQQADV
jgi:hypothetical protein